MSFERARLLCIISCVPLYLQIFIRQWVPTGRLTFTRHCSTVTLLLHSSPLSPSSPTASHGLRPAPLSSLYNPHPLTTRMKTHHTHKDTQRYYSSPMTNGAEETQNTQIVHSVAYKKGILSIVAFTSTGVAHHTQTRVCVRHSENSTSTG